MTEIWRPVRLGNMFAYDGRYKYEVSNLGRVRIAGYFGDRHKYYEPRVLSLNSRKRGGGVYINLSSCGFQKCVAVHRLVALAFIERPEGANFVAHLDGDSSNNRADNLEWRNVPNENLNANPRGRRAVRQYTKDGVLVAEYASGAEASRALGVVRASGLYRCCLRYKSHSTYAGFIWRYVDDDEIARDSNARDLETSSAV